MHEAFEVGGTDSTDEFLCHPDELLVHVDDRDLAAAELEGRYAPGSRRTGSYVVFGRQDGAPTVAAILDQIRRPGSRLRISPQYVFGTCGPRVPMAADRPQSTNRQLPPVAGSGGAITVGVIDTGIVLHDDELDGAAHPWLESRLGGTSIDEDVLTEDAGLLQNAAAHGTFVAGVVLREAPRAAIRAVGTLVDGYAKDELVAEAITRLADDGVRILNLSFSGDDGGDSKAPPLIEEAIAALPDDVVVVAAAGNFGDTRAVWPAAFPRVIAVGAVDDLGPAGRASMTPALAPFSGHGSWVDAYAGGVAVLGPFCWHRESGLGSTLGRLPQHFRGWARWSGTSAATAVVTGRIARTATDEGLDPVDAARVVLRDAPRITVEGEGESFTRPYVVAPARTSAPSG